MKQGITINHIVFSNPLFLFSFMMRLQRTWENSLKKLRIYGNPHVHHQSPLTVHNIIQKKYPSFQSCISSNTMQFSNLRPREILSWRSDSSNLSADLKLQRMGSVSADWCLGVLSVCYKAAHSTSAREDFQILVSLCATGAQLERRQWEMKHILVMQSSQVSFDAVDCII